MVTYESRSHFQPSWTWWRWIMTGLNILALILSSILSWHYIKGGAMIGCGGDSPCDIVLNSKWSMIAGVLPVSGVAVGVYLTMLVAGLYIGMGTEAPIRRLAWKALLLLAGSVAGSAVWFTFIQKWVIGDFCIYCMTTHITGFVLAAFIIWRAIKEFSSHSNNIFTTNKENVKNVPPSSQRRSAGFLSAFSPALIGLVFAGILAASQAGFSSPVVYRNVKSQNNMPTIDYHNVPMLGSPDAPYKIILLFDYECPHCQKLHLMLDETIKHFDGKLAFALCPTPLNTQCNPYISHDVDEFKNSCELAKICLAVWVARRDTFPVFDNWMYTFETGDRWHPRSLEDARTKAIKLVGQEKFNAALSDPWIGQYIQTCIRIYGQTLQSGNGGVPKLIFGSRWVIPEPNNADDLVKILENSLGVPKP